jgi:Rieske Fe-S protein
VTRRSVLGGAAVAAVAGAVGYVVASNSSAADAKTAGTAANGYAAAPSKGRRLLALSQIPRGGGTIMRHDLIVVIRDSNGGSAHAFSATCTHQGCVVGSVSGGTINCPCHGSQFDTTTGDVVTGPATSPLPKIPVTVQNGVVYTA